MSYTASTHPSPNFLKCIDYTLANEGGFSKDYNDPGNWTGGAVGSGDLKGTKYGISAAVFPDMDIKNLTIEQAKSIYLTNYWDANSLESLPVGIGYLIFDACVNSGSAGVKFIQDIVGVLSDGDLGPITEKAIKDKVASSSVIYVGNLYQTRHLQFLSGLSEWHLYKDDFIKRNIYNMAVLSVLTANDVSSSIVMPPPVIPV